MMGSQPLALINGRIYTMEWPSARAEAILIESGKITAVGSTEEVLSCAPEKTRFIDLAGRVAIPGFVDSHTHLVSYGLDLRRLDLSTALSLDEALEMVREALKERNPSKPLIAVNWDQSLWKDPRIPTVAELDRVSRRDAIILRRICGHIAVANSAALQLLPRTLRKIDWRRGLLFGDAPLDLNEIFPPDTEEIVSGLEKAMDVALSIGVTSIHDIASLRYYRVYRRLRGEGRLKLRVYVCFKQREMDQILKLGILRENGDDWLQVGGIKIFADGSLGARTAALSRPYLKSSDMGILKYSFAELVQIMREVDKYGFQLLIHAIGDQAVGQVLAAYENVLSRGNPLRHRIEHCEIASRAQIKKIRELGLITCMQPNFVAWQFPGGMYEQMLGARMRGMANRIGDMIRASVVVAFGSDCMPFSPVYGLWGAVEHPNSEQRISVESALKAYTRDAAYASFGEKVKGSLIPGKMADLIVLSESVQESEDVRKTEILLTIVNGKIAYSDSRVSGIAEKS